ncbi:hypothetical protein FOL47_004319 [Perkinsus chesapeaki]|uniref:Uncharacterized protein n=1 Tax=Perkinsus chesapeaki TaxID=330153 RepID=A0A7J6M3J0_PERCH|nr:hypothetical protein FOL47_004319 [Perkinsus chesapeaki]
MDNSSDDTQMFPHNSPNTDKDVLKEKLGKALLNNPARKSIRYGDIKRLETQQQKRQEFLSLICSEGTRSDVVKRLGELFDLYPRKMEAFLRDPDYRGRMSSVIDSRKSLRRQASSALAELLKSNDTSVPRDETDSLQVEPEDLSGRYEALLYEILGIDPNAPDAMDQLVRTNISDLERKAFDDDENRKRTTIILVNLVFKEGFEVLISSRASDPPPRGAFRAALNRRTAEVWQECRQEAHKVIGTSRSPELHKLRLKNARRKLYKRALGNRMPEMIKGALLEAAVAISVLNPADQQEPSPAERVYELLTSRAFPVRMEGKRPVRSVDDNSKYLIEEMPVFVYSSTWGHDKLVNSLS